MEMAVGIALIIISLLLIAGITWEVSRNLSRSA
jgi:hypothetical protein